jgi:hypothetical protein
VPPKKPADDDTGHRDWGSVARHGRGGSVSYSNIDADLLRRAVANCTAGGAGIVLSLTQDQGAYSVRVLDNGQVHKWYPADEDELRGLLDDLSEL